MGSSPIRSANYENDVEARAASTSFSLLIILIMQFNYKFHYKALMINWFCVRIKDVNAYTRTTKKRAGGNDEKFIFTIDREFEI